MVRIGVMGRTATETPARVPDDSGYIERDGVRVWWEAYGSGEPAILLMPTWSIVHSRHWKAQIHYLARHFRVVTFDGRGNGLSDRPEEEAAYAGAEYVADAVAVLDATGVEQAVVAGLSCGGRYALALAAHHPDRVRGVIPIAPSIPSLTPPHPWRAEYDFDTPLEEYEGWAKDNRHYWLSDYRGFLEFFFSELFNEPHSTKQIEDCVAWGLDTSPEVLLLTECDVGYSGQEGAEALCRGVTAPVLVIHGDADRITPFERGVRVAELTGGRLVRFESSGHAPQAREPVRVNRLIREFADRVGRRPATPARWIRAQARRRRALYVSSPIGLGHAWRDVAIADQLRRRVPDLEIQWLAQSPVTEVLERRGEAIHPASAELASESRHFDLEAREHELHAFEALRRMDEILCANFMVFHDVVREDMYDLWIGDEAWDVDHFLHENPELKTAAYAWLTDFVGFLPLPERGEREAFLAADYNAEMIEHVERFPRVRDRAIFVGDPEDIVPGAFGAGLPEIRAWTEQHYDFCGYIPAVDPASMLDRAGLRAELGWDEETVCVVAVGGTGVGAPLLRRLIDALPAVRERVPDLRMIAVAGPRIDVAGLPRAAGLEVRGYVHELHRELSACDIALVQGGLTTTMELVAARRPFVSFPLAGHFEQRLHVRHRLERHGARASIDYVDVTPDGLAETVARVLAAPVDYLPIPADGADRAAALIADLL
jgi:pimeloyl-ACP methyl ester carboxylesterase/predicted glycosyltransferase